MLTVPRQVVKQTIPYVLCIKTPTEEFIWRGGRKKGSMFKTRDGAEQKALELSKQNPKWVVTVKLSNGIPL